MVELGENMIALHSLNYLAASKTSVISSEALQLDNHLTTLLELQAE
jgi:hypothetical protein